MLFFFCNIQLDNCTLAYTKFLWFVMITLISSVSKQTFIKHLLCAKHYTKNWEYEDKWNLYPTMLEKVQSTGWKRMKIWLTWATFFNELSNQREKSQGQKVFPVCNSQAWSKVPSSRALQGMVEEVWNANWEGVLVNPQLDSKFLEGERT